MTAEALQIVPRRTGEPIGGFWLELTCPRCGGALMAESTGNPATAGTRITAIVRCSACRRPWQVVARLLDAHPDIRRGREAATVKDRKALKEKDRKAEARADRRAS